MLPHMSLAAASNYPSVLARIDALLTDEPDWVAAMATVACELHRAFERFHWTGFYRAEADGGMVIGPYQGSHGCIRIPVGRGVCGAAARAKQTQLVPDVSKFPGHIACSATTRSEIVVPVLARDDRLVAVLDIDSDFPDAFGGTDVRYLEELCCKLGRTYGGYLPS